MIVQTGIIEVAAIEPIERSFGPIPLDLPNDGVNIDARFFETIPTVWAQAHAFEKSLLDANIANSADPALGEWLSLFALDLMKVTHFNWITSGVLQDKNQYDPDFWSALNRTWPRAIGELEGIGALSASGVTVGGYYPTVCFFPARGRAKWAGCNELTSYVDGSQLVWENVRRGLLNTPEAALKFREHLLGVAAKLTTNPAVGARLKELVGAALFFEHHARVVCTETVVDADPTKWQHHQRVVSKQKLLDSYPLKRVVDGKTTYYLVANIPEPTEWMTSTVADITAPCNYHRTSKHSNSITVHHRFGSEVCDLGNDEAVVDIAELLLREEEVLYCCTMPVVESGYLDIHKKAAPLVADANRAALSDDETAVYFFPGRPALLKHFPEIADLSKSDLKCEVDYVSSKVVWTWKLERKEFRFVRPVFASSTVANLRLAIWPPKQSPSWKFYVARGSGARVSKTGSWCIVGDDGTEGHHVALDDDVTYLSVLHTPDRATPPRALWLRDPDEPEKRGHGLLFLTPLNGARVKANLKADLAVDFGTNNTSVAYKLDSPNSAAQVLKFTLAPLCVWWADKDRDQWGFAPQKWGGKKGYFPSVLMALRNKQLGSMKVIELRPEHLFMVDIPGLHADLGVSFSVFTRLYDLHDNLKWRWLKDEAWGHLFLALTLLYSHAELCLEMGATVDSHTFTYPLAFSAMEHKRYEMRATESVNKIAEFVYGRHAPRSTVKSRDESSAIAEFAMMRRDEHALQTYIDIGGGTTDVAIIHEDSPVVLDSVKVAGAAFFSAADEVLKDDKILGATIFYKQLTTLLTGSEGGAAIPPDELLLSADSGIESGAVYSLWMNELSEDDFLKRELAAYLVEEGLSYDGFLSLPRFRTLLIFRHVIAYALIQACAVLAHGGPDARNPIMAREIELALSGNGWGLLVYAGKRRAADELLGEAQAILQMILRLIRDSVASDEEFARIRDVKVTGVKLVGEGGDSGAAKSAVARGALGSRLTASTTPDSGVTYTGVNITELSADAYSKLSLRWCDPWTLRTIVEKLPGDSSEVKTFDSVSFALPRTTDKPLDPLLSVFSRLAREKGTNVDPLGPADWRGINSELQGASYLENRRLKGPSPLNVFLSQILYPREGTATTTCMLTLAKASGCMDKKKT